MTHPHFNGTRASRHVILRQLGHGNLTRVFLAVPRSPAQGDLVVLELLHRELARDDDLRALFLDQAAATLSLHHPNLVRTLDVISDPGACGVTREFLPGQTLAHVIERVGRQRFPVDLHLHILCKVLDALDHIHRAHAVRAGQAADRGHAAEQARPGFAHGDVCPSNVFITYEGEIKLLGTGFGDALRTLEARLGRPLTDIRYAAPELLLGCQAGPSSDLFGVGVMIWEAVTRQARVGSEDAKTIIRRRTSGEEPDLERVWADAPEPLMRLCSRALAVSSQDRHDTIAAFRAELEAYLSRSAETSEAVLARLPELMAASFGPERQQMQRFIGARLGSVDADASSLGDVDDELTPHEEEWTAATSTRAPPVQRAGVEGDGVERIARDIVRTGLRHARAQTLPPRPMTGVHERARPAVELPGAPSESPDPRASSMPAFEASPAPRFASIPAFEASPAPARAARASRLLGPSGSVDASSNPAPFPSERSASISASAPEPPPEATTSGHRAFSSNLDSAPRSRRARARLNADVLGATALLVGSLVATYSIYRHAQRGEASPESQTLAIQAVGDVATAAQPPSEPASDLPAAAPSASPEPVDPLAPEAAPGPPAPPSPEAEPPGTAPPPAAPAPATAARAASIAEAPPAAAPPSRKRRRPASASGASVAAAPSAFGESDEASELSATTSAFFDGHAASSARHRPPPQLSAEELPAADPALRSLQDAIVTAAKMRRLVLEQRRAKKAAASRARPAAALPRPIDDTDPYGEPSPP